MKILRIVLGLLAAAYGLFSLFPIYCNVAWKAGWWTKVPPDIQRLVPLWEATPWWQLVIWLVEVALLLAAAWQLFRGRRALRIYLAAMVAELAKWAFMKTMPAYREAFTPAEIQADYYTLAALVVVGALIWWTERRPATAASPA